MKNAIKKLFSNKLFVILAMLLNISFFVLSTFFFSFYTVYWTLSLFTTAILAILITNNKNNYCSKLLWILTCIILPFFAITLWLVSTRHEGSKIYKKRMFDVSYRSSQIFGEEWDAKTSFDTTKNRFKKVGKYLSNTTMMPVYQNTDVEYLPSGEDFYRTLLIELQKAKKFILLELPSIQDGILWKELFDVIREKARTNVEVKLIYDDVRCIGKFDDKKVFHKLSNHKIEVVPFNRNKLGTKLLSNVYDNRKVVVIDGLVALVGTIGVKDKSINQDNKLGIVKGAGVKVYGEAVGGFTASILNMYQLITKKNIDTSLYKYKGKTVKTNSFVQPFSSDPLMNADVEKDTYLQLINNAQQSIVITTPYIIMDNEVRNVLKRAVLSGIDVKIVLPGVAEKKWKMFISRTYYSQLIKAGIKIYEFSPGVVHSNTILIDDECALIGSIECDFRRVKREYQAGIVLYGKEATDKVVADVNETLGQSRLVTLRDVRKRNFFEKIFSKILRLFAPII